MNPLLGVALASGASSIVGGAMSAAANAREAEKNRQFQERMSSTQYQRGMADMRKAGLNPALAYMQGGASSPAGSVMDVSQLGEGVRRGVTSALEAASARQSLEILKTEREKLEFERGEAMYRRDLTHLERDRFAHWLGLQADGSVDPDSPFAAEMRGARYKATGLSLGLEEQKVIAEMWRRMGTSGKMVQMWAPILMRLMRGGR